MRDENLMVLFFCECQPISEILPFHLPLFSLSVAQKLEAAITCCTVVIRTDPLP